MAQQNYILAVDQSTTSSAAFVIDHEGRVVALAKREITQFYPKPGWVSHDPEELFRSVIAVSQEAMASAGIGSQQLAVRRHRQPEGNHGCLGPLRRGARLARHRLAMPPHRPDV